MRAQTVLPQQTPVYYHFCASPERHVLLSALSGLCNTQVQHVAHGFDTLGEDDGLNASSRGESDTQQLKRQRKAFLHELDAMVRLRSPHTVNVYGAITSLPNRLVLVLELLAGGDLRNMLKRAEHPLPEAQCRQIIGDICAGMAFLHSKATVHGDLKSANILLDGHGRAKACPGGVCFYYLAPMQWCRMFFEMILVGVLRFSCRRAVVF